MSKLLQHYDVIVIGGGPSGLAAATECRLQGVLNVLVLERELVAGGMPRHCLHSPFGLREYKTLMRGPRYAQRLIEEAEKVGVNVVCAASVMALLPGPCVQVSTHDGVVLVHAKRVIVATGARESSRAARLIGGVKTNGVYSTGALQSLIHAGGQKPFQRPVIVGTELVAFSALLSCRSAGIKPVCMIESEAGTTARWPCEWYPKLLGIPIQHNTSLHNIAGESHVTHVVVRTSSSLEQSIETDGVVISGQFIPEASLLAASHMEIDPATQGPYIDQYGRCSDVNYYAAGNVLRAVETAGWCWQEGRSVGAVVAASLRTALAPSQHLSQWVLADHKLRYVMPQRWSWQSERPAFQRIQLRVNTTVRGKVIAISDTTPVWQVSVNTRPERRITAMTPTLQHGTSPSLELPVKIEVT